MARYLTLMAIALFLASCVEIPDTITVVHILPETVEVELAGGLAADVETTAIEVALENQ